MISLSEQANNKWEGRPGVARALRVFVAGAPIVISIILVTIAGRIVTRPDGLALSIVWWAGLSVLATLVVLGLDRVFRRLMPVVALFQLSLVFPDKAPSRFSAAMRAGTVKQLQRKMDSGEFSAAAPPRGSRTARQLGCEAERTRPANPRPHRTRPGVFGDDRRGDGARRTRS